MRLPALLVLPFWIAGAVRAGVLPFPVVDTGQSKCFDERGEIVPPKPGEPFYGQDAQFAGHPFSYSLSRDGMTVTDNVTRLIWPRSPDTDGDGVVTMNDKLTWEQAQALPARLNAARFGGFSDWRLPGIKELYSLFDARGTDPSGFQGGDTSVLRPYLDTNVFRFAYGDERAGARIIDAQYGSSTKYVGKSPRGGSKAFGVNFADGRIKGYDLQMPGGSREFRFFVQCVRGNPAYGRNEFRDRGDGTVDDLATGLTWTKGDSGKGMNWKDALAWAQQRNAARYLGHDDWRVPSVKELQSIVDYSRSPDTSQTPSIDPVFSCTRITNEAGQVDYPFYWSATTHRSFVGAAAAMYVAFGRAAGWMSGRSLAGGPPERRGGGGPAAMSGGRDSGGDFRFVDVHGAGAQRSDPKIGDPADFPHGRGPQGDVIRIFNFVRLVRGGVAPKAAEPPSANSSTPSSPGLAPAPGGIGRRTFMSPIVPAIDLNGDGTLDAAEIEAAAESLKKADINGDGRVTMDEYLPARPGGMGSGGPGEGGPGIGPPGGLP